MSHDRYDLFDHWFLLFEVHSGIVKSVDTIHLLSACEISIQSLIQPTAELKLARSTRGVPTSLRVFGRWAIELLYRAVFLGEYFKEVLHF